MTWGDIFFDEFLFYFLWLRPRSRVIVYIKLGFPRDPEPSLGSGREKLGFSGFRLIEANERRWDESLSVIEDLKFPVGWSHHSLGLFYENFNILEPGEGNWGFQKLEWVTNALSSQVAIHSNKVISALLSSSPLNFVDLFNLIVWGWIQFSKFEMENPKISIKS